MRIAMVSPYDIGTPSGVNVHVTNLSREIRSRGHEVTCFFPGEPGDGAPEGSRFIGRAFPVPSGDSVARIALSPFLGRQVSKALNEGDYDVVHIHEPLTPMLPLQFLRQSRALTIGTFHAAHDNGSKGYLLAGPVLRRMAPKLHGRIAVSPAAARLVLRYFPGSYEIIPNGIETDRFRVALDRPPQLVGKDPYILFVGRFEERKGLPILLRAFAELKARVPQVHLVVVGAGGRRKNYEEWVSRRAVPDVHFAGYVPDELLPAYYQHAAVFCAPNTGNESFGIVLLEAMAAGCPVVASNIQGFAELVVYGAHGLLVTPRSSSALSDVLTRVFTDEKLRTSLASRGADHVEQFAWPVVADRILSYYEEVAERRGIALGSRPAGARTAGSLANGPLK
ncbi:MAG: glycosyltransferase family 4 protein [Dehalococcoidia bacterium]|uniref:glycosyltransferase family 4 protein n=1 Tax=Candidatus Amarobacter glycogenicus TaxID=3140699 RepID=UPI00313769D7|nr:glycosyltransferase family 4 protein [Dehalococcoidia bacterium]